MGTPEFAVPALNALFLSDKHKIKAVFTASPKPKGRGMNVTPSPVGKFAEEKGLEVFTPKTLKSKEIHQQIDQIKADIIVVVAYGFIIPKPILDSKRYGCLNIHPSLLPKYRGAAPLQRTIMNGEKETAVCIMQMDEGLDTGDILMSKRFDLEPDITLSGLHDKSAKLGAESLLEVLDNIDSLERIKQDSLIKDGKCIIDNSILTDDVAYAKKLTKEEAEISWSDPSYVIDRKIRGTNPWPGAYFNINNMRYFKNKSGEQEYFKFSEDRIIKIIRSEAVEMKDIANYPSLRDLFDIGDIISDEFEILCGDGAIIKLLEIKPQGKQSMSGREFLRGVNAHNSSSN